MMQPTKRLFAHYPFLFPGSLKIIPKQVKFKADDRAMDKIISLIIEKGSLKCSKNIDPASSPFKTFFLRS
jgi:hypothetical protein